MELAFFAARIDVCRQVLEKTFIQLPSGEAAIQYFTVNANGDGSKMLGVEKSDQLARVALPDGKKSLHARSIQIPFAVGAQVFEKNIAERHHSHPLFIISFERMCHALLVKRVNALRWYPNLVERQPD